MIEPVPAKYKSMTEVERYRRSYFNTSANNKINQLRRRKKNLIEGATKDELEKWAKRKNKTILSLEDQETDLDDLLNPELERALQPDKLWPKEWEIHHFVAMRNRESKNVSNYKGTKLSDNEIKARHDENLKKKG
uniref:Pre-mRNA-splicing factor SYF2 n=1 Tax=Rhabditophanes sp. KR3021 TaxID=114890 RepID=A0AC35UH51_9BILA